MSTVAEKARNFPQKMTLRQYRRFVDVTLDELALEMGEGYSNSRLSLMERGLYACPPEQEQVVREAIGRIVARRGDGK